MLDTGWNKMNHRQPIPLIEFLKECLTINHGTKGTAYMNIVKGWFSLEKFKIKENIFELDSLRLCDSILKYRVYCFTDAS